MEDPLRGSAWRIRYSPRLRLISGGLVVLFCAFFASFALYDLSRLDALGERGHRTTAAIVERRNRDELWEPAKLSYAVRGSERQVELLIPANHKAEGIEVVYDPEDPAVVALVAGLDVRRGERERLLIVCGVLGALGLLTVAHGAYERRRSAAG